MERFTADDCRLRCSSGRTGAASPNLVFGEVMKVALGLREPLLGLSCPHATKGRSCHGLGYL